MGVTIEAENRVIALQEEGHEPRNTGQPPEAGDGFPPRADTLILELLTLRTIR